MKIEREEALKIMDIADGLRERLKLGQTACDYFAAILFIVSSVIEKFEQLGEVCTATELDNLKKTLIGMVISDLYGYKASTEMAVMLADMIDALEILDCTEEDERKALKAMFMARGIEKKEIHKMIEGA